MILNFLNMLNTTTVWLLIFVVLTCLITPINLSIGTRSLNSVECFIVTVSVAEWAEARDSRFLRASGPGFNSQARQAWLKLSPFRGRQN